MESFFWTLLYVALKQNLPLQNHWDKDIYQRLVPDNRPYATDAFIKQGLLEDLRDEKMWNRDSVLNPYKQLLVKMAEGAHALFRRSRVEDPPFQGYSYDEEVEAMDSNIDLVRKFLAPR